MGKVIVQIALWGLLCVVSAILYAAHIWIFHDPRQMSFYLVEDLAFLPIQVLVVSLIIHRLLHWRDEQTRAMKVNVVIGAFFSEVGTDLLRLLLTFDAGAPQHAAQLKIKRTWTRHDFLTADRANRAMAWAPVCSQGDLAALQHELAAQRPTLLRLLENPNVLEHELFTELLWAVFHLAEELQARPNLQVLPVADREHLNGDMKRVMRPLTAAWLAHIEHLSRDYPYLFSLAIRTNPFDPSASIFVTE